MNSKLVICLFSILALSHSFTYYSFFDEADSNNWDLTKWQSTNVGGIANSLTECGGEALVGGYDVFGKQNGNQVELSTIDPLPINYPHSELTFSFDIYAIDSWDPNLPNGLQLDSVFLYIDGQQEYEITKQWDDCDEPTQICGAGSPTSDFYWKEYVYHFEITVDHSANDVDISFVSNFDQHVGDESWGINNFKVKVDQFCQQCPDGFYFDGVECQKCMYKCTKCTDWCTCQECEQEDGNPFQRVLPTCWCEYQAEDVNGSCQKPSCPEGQSLSHKNAHEDKWECITCADNCAKCTQWSCQECKGANRQTWNCDLCIYGYSENDEGECVLDDCD